MCLCFGGEVHEFFIITIIFQHNQPITNVKSRAKCQMLGRIGLCVISLNMKGSLCYLPKVKRQGSWVISWVGGFNF